MILVKNWKFPLCLFLDKISFEIIFDNHLVRKQSFQDYKNTDFTYLAYWIFSGGLTHDFGQKLKISSLFVLRHISPGNNVLMII